MKNEEMRCTWPGEDPLMISYHDQEWGTPVHDDRKHFEFLILEAAQAGLSWKTVLHKREGYRKAFYGFDPIQVAKIPLEESQELLKNPAIIRNKLKVAAAIHNATCFIEIQREFGSFDAYCWKFVDHRPIVNHWKNTSQIPSTSPISDAFSKDLKKRGFKFVGSTVIYAHMQAVGMVNDHLTNCFRYRNLMKKGTVK